MYLGYFNLDSQPFSIVPDHRVLYMSPSHREAVAHLLYALSESGGFVQLTGEVGTGKTTISRYILANLPENIDVALLLNPRVTEKEMLETICDELGIAYTRTSRQKDLSTLLNEYLLESHANGRRTVLMVDEAQNLSRKGLEQVRLLTNLETPSAKLLQIILIGQPELSQTLQRHDLRQLSQRIVARFSLKPLNRHETSEYIEHRLTISGVQRPLFSQGAVTRIYQLSGGIPRLINVLADRALLGAYSQNLHQVNRRIVNQAGREVTDQLRGSISGRVRGWLKYAAIAAMPLLAYLAYQHYQNSSGYDTGSKLDHPGETVADADLSASGTSVHVNKQVAKLATDQSPGKQDKEANNLAQQDVQLNYRLGVLLLQSKNPGVVSEQNHVGDFSPQPRAC